MRAQGEAQRLELIQKDRFERQNELKKRINKVNNQKVQVWLQHTFNMVEKTLSDEELIEAEEEERDEKKAENKLFLEKKLEKHKMNLYKKSEHDALNQQNDR
jgi:hypothetical protein